MPDWLSWVSTAIAAATFAGTAYAGFRAWRKKARDRELGPVAHDDLRRSFMKLRNVTQTYAQLLDDVQAGRSIVDPNEVWPKLWENLLAAKTELWNRKDEVKDWPLQQSIAGACGSIVIGNRMGRPVTREDAERIIESCEAGLARLDKLQYGGVIT